MISEPFSRVGAPIPVAVGVHFGAAIVALAFLFAAMFAYVSIRFARTLGNGRRAVTLVVAAQCLVGVILVASPLLLSSDVYSYVLYGRMWGILGMNPYHPQIVNPHGDALTHTCLNFVANPPFADPYGPLWTLLAGAIARAEAHASLSVALLSQRLIALGSAVALTLGLLRLSFAWSPVRSIRRVALIATHPLLLYESAVGGHNDTIMMALAVWAFALCDEFPMLAAVLFALAVSVKIVALAVAPFLVIKLVRGNWKTAIPASAIAVLIIASLYVPFLEARSPIAALPAPRSDIGFSAVGLLYLIAWTWVPLGSAALSHVLTTAFLVSGVAVVVASIATYAVRRGRAPIWTAIAATLWSLPAVFTWYVPWLFPAIADKSRWSIYAWWLGLFMFLQYAFVTPDHRPTLMLIGIAIIIVLAPVLLARRVPLVDA